MSKANTDKSKILSKNLFPVVGIGASAGGLEAFKHFIKAIPENSGMAYILVQHLHPQYESALPEILQRVTKIPVIEISDNIHVEPDHIYVIPSNKLLVATDGILQLSPRSSKDRLNLPINVFFASLAEVHQAHAIGVILSGTGADGSLGLKDIKDHGGLTFAQDPESASYDGMPQHAIDDHVVDFILAPEKIPERLMELQHSFPLSASGNEIIPKEKTDEDSFRQILVLLRLRVGVDFSYYKQTTVRRRIIRRMLILKLETITEYLDYVKMNKAEPDILFQDLLIPVTSFFRDPATFESLCEHSFPEIVKTKSISKPLRLWIAGCSSGEEAYSMAICLHEFLSDNISNIKIQIFATDISENAIKKARTGIYSKKDIEGISDFRLQQFFNKSNGQYQVKKTVRDLCVFAVHNFLKDPPFANLDLISCRNVLIYLEPFLQKKAFAMFHYALNDKGTLLLGKSETTGNSSELFMPSGKNDKLYIRKDVPGRFRNVASERSETAFTDRNYYLRSKEGKTDDFQKNADDILLLKHTPVGVVVNEQFDIVQFRGATGEYLEASPGKPSSNVLKMAREGLAFELRNALHKAKTTGEPFIKDSIAINNEKRLVTLEVIPLLNTIDLHYLILFKDQLPAVDLLPALSNKQKGAAEKIKLDEKDIRILYLEKELVRSREDMRSITEDQEAANEELQSSNEELLSGSEELQSLNEELETSKEELQSTNEELITVNQELYDRNEELGHSRRFAEATIEVLHEPLLVLDKNFIIKSANRSFYETFQLTEDDTLGKLLFELQNQGWEIPGLRKALLKIQRTHEKMIEEEVVFTFPVIGERIVCFNIQPINRETGEQLILLALDDITMQKKAQKILKEKAESVAKEHEVLHGFLMEAPALFAILKGPEYVFEFANTLYHKFTGNRDIIGKKLIEALPEVKGQGFLEILDKVYTTGQPYIGREMLTSIEVEKGKLEEHYINFNYEPIFDEQRHPKGILVFAYDVTEIVQGRKHLQRNAKMIQEMYMNAPAYVCTLMGPDHVYELVNPSYQKLFGTRKIAGKAILKALPELVGQGFDKILDNVYNTGEIFLGNEVLILLAYDEGLEPSERYFNFSYQPIYDEENKITGVLVFGYEVTEQLLAKKIQLEYAQHFRTIADTMPQKMNTTDPAGNIDYLNQQWYEYTKMNFADLKDWNWEKIIHPDDRASTVKRWEEVIKSGEEYHLEHRFLRFDGTYRWHLTRGLAQKDAEGKIISWIGTHTDIEEQKKKEHQKDEFISIASHEMKTPLTSAKAYLQLLEMSIDKKDEATSLYVKKASHAVSRLSELISELMDVSKIQHGKLDYNISTFNFNEMIKHTVEDINSISLKHAIVATGTVGSAVEGDRERLQQVVINLLNNAIKYSPDSLDVYINVAEKDGEVKVSVKDNGIGISKQHLNKIFDRYYRVEEHAIQFQGLGIGLFISNEIIQRHHGKLWAESEPGKGSTFSFTIPAHGENIS